MFISSDTRSVIPQIIVSAAIVENGLNTIIIPNIRFKIDEISIIFQLGLSADFKLKPNWIFKTLFVIIQHPTIIGRKALIILGLNTITKPSIIQMIPSINSKLKVLISFALEKYDIVWIIPSITKKIPRKMKTTVSDVSGLNIKNKDSTIRQIDKIIELFAYLFIYSCIRIPPFF